MDENGKTKEGGGLLMAKAKGSSGVIIGLVAIVGCALFWASELLLQYSVS